MIANSTMQRPRRELVEQIRKEYIAGESLWSLGNRYFGQISRSDLRQCLEGVIRAKGCPKEPDLDEAEVARRRDAIRETWTEEQAAKRWVGRYLSRPEELGESFSRTLRQMGGDC